MLKIYHKLATRETQNVDDCVLKHIDGKITGYLFSSSLIETALINNFTLTMGEMTVYNVKAVTQTYK